MSRPLGATSLGSFMAAAVAFLALCLMGGVVGCAPEEDPREARRGDLLVPGIMVSADLDGDQAHERVLFDAGKARLTIRDGSIVYRSRDKWRIVEAFLADTDGNGRTEIVALLETLDGRHLGLFGFSPGEDGGTYRELIVTSALRPHPHSLRVLRTTGPDGQAAEGDLVILAEEVAGGIRQTTYRWNGFGFTAVGLDDTEK